MTQANGWAASKIAEVLSDVLTLHAPNTARTVAVHAQEVRDEWLERLEDHSMFLVAPIIDKVLAMPGIPPEYQHLLSEMKDPSAALGSFAQQFLIYGIGFSIAGKITEPFLQAVSNLLWPAAAAIPDGGIPISPAALSTAVVRGIGQGDSAGVDVPDWATAEAAKSGVSASDFLTLVGVSGEAPALQLLFEMIRRSIITEDQLTQGIKEGDIKDKWIPFVEKLRYVQPSPADFVRAAIQSQMDYADASAWATQTGLEPAGYLDDNPDWFKLLYDVAGRPPGPGELGEMANRGIIPWTGTGPDALSFQQGIAESDVKTKWTNPLQQRAAYVPPPRAVGSLLKSGSITADQAKSYWEQGGVPAALAAAYVHQATVEETIEEKTLAKGDVLKGLYEGIFTQTETLALLSTLGYTGKTANDMVQLTLMRREFAAISKAVNAVGSLYVHYKMTETDAQTTLRELGIPDDQVSDLLNIWTIQRKPEVRIPSITELGKAVKYGGLEFDAAVKSAQLLGYTAYDASIIISGAAETPPPNGFPPNTDTGVSV